tara:strand:- start:62 stop:259 length:198 start_codon:yes stop_codon:yes gene_type:complete
MKTFEKYKKNLKADDNAIYSYNTKVAVIEANRIVQIAYHSVTTQKHIRYAAIMLNLRLIETKIKL